MNLLRLAGIKIGILYGVALLASYLFFRVQLISFSPYILVFSIFLILAELHTIFHLTGLLYSIWPRKKKSYNQVNFNKSLRLNLFICVCGEPPEIIRESILAAIQAANKYTSLVQPYVEPTIVVLNDGYGAQKYDWYEVAQICNDLGVQHMLRYEQKGFKAGNINNGLRMLPTNDPHNTVDIVLDADIQALPDFLIEITKPLADQSVDFVQSPQRYYDSKTWVAKAAKSHQSFFYDLLCPAKGYDNAMFLCGTNFAIRREALDAVGGFDERFVTEDYATSLSLHFAGKKGVYIHKNLAYGLAPLTLKAYFSQQRRWAQGTFDSTRANFRKILFGPLTPMQKFHYLLASTYYLIGVRDLILLLAPLPYLFFGTALIKANTLTFLTFIYAPLMFYNFILYFYFFKEPIKSLVLDIISFPVYIGALFASILKRHLAFIVTDKRHEHENIFKVYKIQFIAAVLLLLGVGLHLQDDTGNILARRMNYFWAFYNIAFISIGFLMIIRDRYNEKLLRLSGIPFPKIVPSYLMTKNVLIPFLIVAFIFSLSRTPQFRIFASRENMQTFVNTVQNKEAVQDLLVPSQGVYYGYYRPETNKHPKNPTVGLIPGEKPSLVMYYQGWGNEPEFDLLFVTSLSNQNVIPVITWEPWSIKKAQAGDIIQPEYAPSEIIAGKYDSYIRKFAKDAALYKKPFFLRFAHEMNGNWYPWGDFDGTNAEVYKKMWVHVYRIFQEEGATNAIWVWSPNNTDIYGSSDSILSYYPGDAYVDWVGFSGFNWGTASEYTSWTHFDAIAENAYRELSTINKPIMITETSSVSKGGDKAAWFQRTIKADIPKFKNIKAVIFFNDDYKYADFSLMKGMPTYRVIYNNIVRNNYYLSNPLLVKRFVEKK